LIGDTKGHLGQSIYLREIEGREEGAAPHVDLKVERVVGDVVRKLISDGRIDTVHDCSDGGVLVAVAEMAMASGIGAEVGAAGTPDAIPFFFGEDQARYVIAGPVAEIEKVRSELDKAKIVHAVLGKTGGKDLTVSGAGSVAVAELRRAHEGWFPAYMGGEEIPATN
ncbi:MAG TPA: AIR synthase-related protein, partial [Rhizomicrobium sp.]|nr:AIR synthase-related protein [Rhizomicrobium sp.]